MFPKNIIESHDIKVSGVYRVYSKFSLQNCIDIGNVKNVCFFEFLIEIGNTIYLVSFQILVDI